MVLVVEGEVVSEKAAKQLYLALWRNEAQQWVVSGVFYRSPEEGDENLRQFVKTALVFVAFPESALLNV